MELTQRLTCHLALMLVCLNLGSFCAFLPFLDEETDILSLPFLGFPCALPAVYLQTIFIYSMLASAMLLHRLMLALAGFDSLDSMRQPLLLSTSIKEFWGRRWNLLIHNLMWRSFFKPLAARGGSATKHAGAIAAFVMSGLFHEYMWLITNWYHMDTYTLGYPSLFFLIQFALTAMEGML